MNDTAHKRYDVMCKHGGNSCLCIRQNNGGRMNNNEDRTSHYRKDSLTLVGAVALGTGVMIGAGIFALTGQMAEMTGGAFPFAASNPPMIAHGLKGG